MYERQDVWRISYLMLTLRVYIYRVEHGHFLSLQRGYNTLAGPK